MRKILRKLKCQGWRIAKKYKGGYSVPDGLIAVKSGKAIEVRYVHWTGKLEVCRCMFA